MRTTEEAELSFRIADTNIKRRSDQTSPEVQYARNLAVGLQELSVALRELYDKVQEIDRKLSRPM